MNKELVKELLDNVKLDYDVLLDQMIESYKESVIDRTIVNITIYEDGDYDVWHSADDNAILEREFNNEACRLAQFDNRYYEQNTSDEDILYYRDDSSINPKCNEETKRSINEGVEAVNKGEYDSIVQFLNDKYYFILKDIEEYLLNETLVNEAVEQATYKLDEFIDDLKSYLID